MYCSDTDWSISRISEMVVRGSWLPTLDGEMFGISFSSVESTSSTSITSMPYQPGGYWRPVLRAMRPSRHTSSSGDSLGISITLRRIRRKIFFTFTAFSFLVDSSLSAGESSSAMDSVRPSRPDPEDVQGSARSSSDPALAGPNGACSLSVGRAPACSLIADHACACVFTASSSFPGRGAEKPEKLTPLGKRSVSRPERERFSSPETELPEVGSKCMGKDVFVSRLPVRCFFMSAAADPNIDGWIDISAARLSAAACMSLTSEHVIPTLKLPGACAFLETMEE
mmetsp:Transcript_47284/g.88175  ORF Transcript_47284/g.88175 Transcript_47284/m.88175 type:complete len:283 (-) Transcript_47284:93-941(-)